MKKFFVLFIFALFLVGCESESTYSGMCTDKNGNRIIFSHFRMNIDIAEPSAIIHNESNTMIIVLSEMDEIYMYKNGSKFDLKKESNDKDNKDKESAK
jgi:uncharacterized protein YcfL